MKVVSLFAGCGGSSLGYETAGCQVVAAVEWGAHAVECYRLNHPGTTIFHEDVATVSGERILGAIGLEVGELDVLDGSPPCQGFSTAGRRRLDDPRNSLVREQLRLAAEMHPRHVVIENVVGLLRGSMRVVATGVVGELRALGYEVVVGVLNAAHFGVGQTRRRVFFVASRIGTPRLPRAETRVRSARSVFVGVEPDEILMPRSPSERLLCRHLRPGECGADMLRRLGRKPNWFSVNMLDPDEPAPTLCRQSRNSASVFHWHRRHLSIREALVLQGFPQDYRLTGSFAQRWAVVGNSVCPPVIRAIAQELSKLGC